jgi:hypothetical protein
LSVVVGAWLLSPTPEAEAWSWSSWKQDSSHHQSKGGKHHQSKGGKHHQSKGGKHHQSKGGKHHQSKGGKHHEVVPELDPSAAGSAMVLLLGGMAWIVSHRRNEEFA